jgi:hypothetical protein
MPLIAQTLESNAAMTYVRDVLSQGRSLSRCLLDLDLANGHIWTYLRSDISAKYAQDHLNETWLVSTEAEYEETVSGRRWRGKSWTSPFPLYVEYIRQSLRRGPDSLCVIEDALRRKSDPVIAERLEKPFAFCADDVFYVLKGGDVLSDAIGMGLRETAAWVQTVALCRLPAGEADITPRTEISEEQLAVLARDVDAFLVAAFDGVGFVVWEKESSDQG